MLQFEQQLHEGQFCLHFVHFFKSNQVQFEQQLHKGQFSPHFFKSSSILTAQQLQFEQQLHDGEFCLLHFFHLGQKNWAGVFVNNCRVHFFQL